jgi:hypothetical protein
MTSFTDLASVPSNSPEPFDGRHMRQVHDRIPETQVPAAVRHCRQADVMFPHAYALPGRRQ